MDLHKYIIENYGKYNYDIIDTSMDFYVIGIYSKKKLLFICRGIVLGNYKNNLWSWIDSSIFVSKKMRHHVKELREKKNNDFSLKHFHNIDMSEVVENLFEYGCVIYPKNKKILGFLINSILVNNMTKKININ